MIQEKSEEGYSWVLRCIQIKSHMSLYKQHIKTEKKLNPWEVKILWFAQLLAGMQLRLNGLKPFLSCYCSLRVLWFCEEFIFSLSTIGPILGKDSIISFHLSIRFSLETKERFGCRFQILLSCYCFYIYLYLYIL